MSDSPAPVEISVVIPAYNRAALLARLLDSLAGQKGAPPWEVIVVDDASTDATENTVATWAAAHPEIACRYVRQDVNQGPGSARNRGAEAARGQWVAFTDTDCVADPGWLAGLFAAVRANPEAAGAGGPVKPYDCGNLYAIYNTVNATLTPIVFEDHPIPYLVTCNCLYRRDALLEAGGFTADIGTPGGEDVAASIALYKRGLRFAYAESALIHHDYRDTGRSFVRTWTNYGYGCGLVTHRLLTPEELHPEWGRHGGENYWGVQSVRPTVTGVRSFFRDLRWFRGQCAAYGVRPFRKLQLTGLRIVERLCYYRGWRRGVKQAARERREAR